MVEYIREFSTSMVGQSASYFVRFSLPSRAGKDSLPDREGDCTIELGFEVVVGSATAR